MPFSARGDLIADEIDESSLRGFWIGIGAWMTGPAATIGFSGRNTRNAYARPFGAPDWPVSIPDTNGRAFESMTCRDDSGGEDQGEHGISLWLCSYEETNLMSS